MSRRPRIRRAPEPAKFTGSGASTIHDAYLFIRQHRNEANGALCPVCDQIVKVYRRPLHAGMALVLVHMVRRVIAGGVNDWLHVPSFIRALPLPPGVSVGNGGDWSKLRHWGLIEPRPGTREDGSKRNGYYRVTAAGFDFALGKIAVPAAMLMTNQAVVAKDAKTVTVQQAFGKKFDYSELMSTVQWDPKLGEISS